MEKLVDEGLGRNIGLSNFNSKQIAEVGAIATVPISNLHFVDFLNFDIIISKVLHYKIPYNRPRKLLP